MADKISGATLIRTIRVNARLILRCWEVKFTLSPWAFALVCAFTVLFLSIHSALLAADSPLCYSVVYPATCLWVDIPSFIQFLQRYLITLSTLVRNRIQLR